MLEGQKSKVLHHANNFMQGTHKGILGYKAKFGEVGM